MTTMAGTMITGRVTGGGKRNLGFGSGVGRRLNGLSKVPGMGSFSNSSRASSNRSSPEDDFDPVFVVRSLRCRRNPELPLLD